MTEAGGERRVIRDANGRAKAYRPISAMDRSAAVAAGLRAYEDGDFFEAHELMEPAWMGSDDPAERDLISGLIKLAAADVHGVRGNPRGVARNLEGARDRLRRALTDGRVAGIELDVGELVDAIDVRLAALAADHATEPIAITWRTR